MFLSNRSVDELHMVAFPLQQQVFVINN